MELRFVYLIPEKPFPQFIMKSLFAPCLVLEMLHHSLKVPLALWQPCGEVQRIINQWIVYVKRCKRKHATADRMDKTSTETPWL